MIFQLEPWEIFEAPTGPPPAPSVPIHEVWIDEATHRIFGASVVWPDPIWLNPARVPGRVIRRDPSKPTHPDEWHRIFAESRDRWQHDNQRKPTEDEKIAARLAEMPEPEIRWRPATLEEMPGGAKIVGNRATRAGFDCRAEFARGPRTDQYWNVLETSSACRVVGRHADGRRFDAWWITKTGQRGAKAGVTEWEMQSAHRYVAGERLPCDSTELKAYCQ